MKHINRPRIGDERRIIGTRQDLDLHLCGADGALWWEDEELWCDECVEWDWWEEWQARAA